MYKFLTSSLLGNAFNIGDLFKCLLGLSDREIEIFNYMLEHRGECCDRVAEELQISRSTVQRAMKRLYEMRLVTRDQDFPQGQTRGYTYKYSLVPPDSLRAYLLALVEDAAIRMRALIKNGLPASDHA